MQLVQLIYASQMTAPLSLEHVVAILDVARASNPRRGITGVMTFSQNWFLQALEGPPGEVNALYSALMRDPRHYDLTLIDYREVAQRQFGEWSMGFFRRDVQAPEIFEPRHFSPEQALGHLGRLSAATAGVTS
jgi:hypothetical protein